VHEHRAEPLKLIPGGTRRGDPRLTVKDVAEYFEFSENFVRKAIRDRKLIAILKPTGDYALTFSSVIAWLTDIAYADLDRFDRFRVIAVRSERAA
jgi:hypothetical protein